MKCFEALGLSDEATPEEVKRRYHELAMTHHPDRGGDPAQFQSLTKAYEAAMVIASAPPVCSVCNGEGKVKVSRGFASVKVPCPNCGGMK